MQDTAPSVGEKRNRSTTEMIDNLDPRTKQQSHVPDMISTSKHEQDSDEEDELDELVRIPVYVQYVWYHVSYMT